MLPPDIKNLDALLERWLRQVIHLLWLQRAGDAGRVWDCAFDLALELDLESVEIGGDGAWGWTNLVRWVAEARESVVK